MVSCFHFALQPIIKIQHMRYLAIIILCLCTSISCKKKAEPSDEKQTTTSKDSIEVDTTFHKETEVRYIPYFSINNEWKNSESITEGTIMNVSATHLGNVFVMAEIKKNHSFQHIYVSGINASGVSLGKTHIEEPRNAKYELYESFITEQGDNFPTYYVLRIASGGSFYVPEENKDPEKVLEALGDYSIDRLVFGSSISRYERINTPIEKLLKNFILNNKISRLGTIKFRKYDNKIFLYGDARTASDGESGYPFIILLDNLKPNL